MQFKFELHLIIFKSCVFNCTFADCTLVIDLSMPSVPCFAKPGAGGVWLFP